MKPTGDTAQLLRELHAHLQREATARGDTVDELSAFDQPDAEAHRVGRRGVLAFIGGYAVVGWDAQDMRPAARDAYRVLGRKLAEVGQTRHMVHHRNVPSIILTRKLGAEFLGYDADGYIHYVLTHKGYLAAQAKHLNRGSPNGQEISAAEGT